MLDPETCNECILFTTNEVILSLIEKYDPLVRASSHRVQEDEIQEGLDTESHEGAVRPSDTYARRYETAEMGPPSFKTVRENSSAYKPIKRSCEDDDDLQVKATPKTSDRPKMRSPGSRHEEGGALPRLEECDGDRLLHDFNQDASYWTEDSVRPSTGKSHKKSQDISSLRDRRGRGTEQDWWIAGDSGSVSSHAKYQGSKDNQAGIVCATGDVCKPNSMLSVREQQACENVLRTSKLSHPMSTLAERGEDLRTSTDDFRDACSATEFVKLSAAAIHSGPVSTLSRPTTAAVMRSLLPVTGYVIEMWLLNSWGAPDGYIGLTGVCAVDSEMKEVQLPVPMVYERSHGIADSHLRDTPHRCQASASSLVNGVNLSILPEHSWCVRKSPLSSIILVFQLDEPRSMRGLKVWNFNAGLEDSFCGVKHVRIDIDGITRGTAVLRKAPGEAKFDFAQFLPFARLCPDVLVSPRQDMLPMDVNAMHMKEYYTEKVTATAENALTVGADSNDCWQYLDTPRLEEASFDLNDVCDNEIGECTESFLFDVCAVPQQYETPVNTAIGFSLQFIAYILT